MTKMARTSGRTTNLRWPPILELAAEWVRDQPHLVTLRQCFYHLVATQVIPNDQSTYRALSAKTSAARRADDFPDFADETHSIRQASAWADVDDFADDAANSFGLDRTEGQEFQVVVGVEKRGMEGAAARLFEDRGWRVTALGGFASTTITMDLARLLEADGREAVLIYAGDFDASGEDILRDFTAKVPFDRVIKAALTLPQVREYQLPENPGKATDPRARKFAEKYGTNMQVEVDALDPAVLDRLLVEAAAPFQNRYRFEAVVAREQEMQDRIGRALHAA